MRLFLEFVGGGEWNFLQISTYGVSVRFCVDVLGERVTFLYRLSLRNGMGGICVWLVGREAFSFGWVAPIA